MRGPLSEQMFPQNGVMGLQNIYFQFLLLWYLKKPPYHSYGGIQELQCVIDVSVIYTATRQEVFCAGWFPSDQTLSEDSHHKSDQFGSGCVMFIPIICTYISVISPSGDIKCFKVRLELLCSISKFRCTQCYPSVHVTLLSSSGQTSWLHTSV